MSALQVPESAVNTDTTHTGVSDIYAGVKNKDIATGKALHLTPAEQGERLGSGLVAAGTTIVAGVTLGAKGFGAIRAAPETGPGAPFGGADVEVSPELQGPKSHPVDHSDVHTTELNKLGDGVQDNRVSLNEPEHGAGNAASHDEALGPPAPGAKMPTKAPSTPSKPVDYDKPSGALGPPAPKAAEGPPDLDDLSKAAGEADRGNLTKAGRALQKHGDRPGTAFDRPGSNSPKALNPAGQNTVDDILTNPKSQVKPNRLGGWDVVAPDGRGVRYNQNGSFRGFLEPNK
jgi:hypothetical protein